MIPAICLASELVRFTPSLESASQRHLTLMGEGAVEFDLFADCGLVFTDCLRNGSFSGTVGDPGKNDSSFFQSKVCFCICIGHISYLPFLKAKPDISIKAKCKSNFHNYSSGNNCKTEFHSNPLEVEFNFSLQPCKS